MAQQSVPMFDPYTGQPLQPMYDPYTGQPIAGVSTVQAEDAVTVHPTANGGLHDGATGTILERLSEVEDRLSGLESNFYADKQDTHARPDWPVTVHPTVTTGTADTSSLAATGGVTGNTPPEPQPTLVETGTVPTNDPSAPELAIPAGAPSLTDERNETPISATGSAFEPADTGDVAR